MIDCIPVKQLKNALIMKITNFLSTPLRGLFSLGRQLTSLRILCMVMLLGISITISAQVTVQIKNTPLRSALKTVERNSNYKFFYSESLVGLDQNVSVDVKNGTIDAVMKQLLTGLALDYKKEQNQVVVLIKKESAKGQLIREISGVITSADGEPIIGASVLVEGSSVGTITNFDGEFLLTDIDENENLVVSYIGYQTIKLRANDKRVAKLILQEDSEMMDEVVVVGYGVQRKRDVSTSVVSVKSEQLENIPITDFRQSLSGKMAGVQVIQSSGDPEGNVSIRVRGVSTVTAGSEPLYVVDGVPMQRGLSNINTNDIESVEVLKDASSSAIYGSRGSNGVVLITTKSGKSDKTSIRYDGYYGVQNVSKKIKMMDAYQFALAAKDGHDNAYLDANPGGSASDPNSVRPNSWERIPTELFPYLNGEEGLVNTDWQDAIFRTGAIQNHNISLQGKTQTVNYFISGSYLSNEGIIINSNYKRYGARLNLDGKRNKLKYGINFSPSYSKSNRVDASGNGGVVQSALMMPPVWPVYNQDGSYNYQGNGYWRIGTDYQHNAILNPVAMANLQSDIVDRVSLTGKLFAGYEFIDGVSFTTSLGGEYYSAMNNTYRSKELPYVGHTYYDSPSNGEAYSSSGFYYNWIWENQLTYTKTFANDHNLSIILVQSAQMETYKSNSVSSSLFPNDYIESVGGGIIEKGNSNITQWSLASYLGRVQYSFKGKYLLSAAIRADGSSRFGKNNRWGYFPSGSAAWRVSDEDFFNCDVIDDLKVRASYGVTGNFNIGNYDYIATMSQDDYITGSGNNSSLQPGYKPDNVANNELKWEKNHMANIGFDLSMFKGYFGVSMDLYNTNTTDMLLTIPVPHLTGYSTTLMNIGKVNNKGIELQLTSQQSYKSGFGYSFNANYSRNINEVKELGPGNAPLITEGSVNHATYITQVGGQIGSYYLLVQDGIFETEEDLAKYPHFANTKVGDFRFVDVDQDGVLDLEKDRMDVGNYMPKFTYGFSGSVSYKSVDLSFNFQGVYGNKILNLNQRYINNQEGNVNGMIEGVDRWRSESEPGNGNINRGNRKSTGYNGRTSTFHLEDGSYLRLQNLALGYTLPQVISKKIHLEKLRVYVSGQNLWTLTNYSGYNPEVSARPNSSTTPGEDYGTYPLAKVFSFGLNLTL